MGLPDVRPPSNTKKQARRPQPAFGEEERHGLFFRSYRKAHAVKVSMSRIAAGLMAVTVTVSSANAQIFIYPPDFSGPAVTGIEPGIGLPLPGANPDELRASLLWNLRAGLNVAALQCQFSPTLATVRNYNQLLRHQRVELDHTRLTLESYFKRIAGTNGPRSFDQYTTRTYNSFSTLYAQLGFCHTAALIGRAALDTPKGELHKLATFRLRELRNSLTPAGDRLFSISNAPLSIAMMHVPCLDKSSQKKNKC